VIEVLGVGNERNGVSVGAVKSADPGHHTRRIAEQFGAEQCCKFA
jgi:hypothetical protein